MSTIIGHDRQREYLNKVIARGRLAHAYVFAGQEHVGKLTIAKTLAASLFCEATRNSGKHFEDACGNCLECVQARDNRNTHIFFLDTQRTLTSKKETRSDIPIEDIRELKHQFSLAPADKKMRVVIMNGAEKLSPHAANAFLKLLEEPSPNVVFILITTHEESLLPTIRSRAQIIRFGTVSETLLASVARVRHAAAHLASYASGRPGILMRLIEDQEFVGVMEKRATFMDRMLRSSIPDILRAAEKIAGDRDARHDAMWFLFSLLRGVMAEKVADGNRMNFLESMKKIHRIHYLMETTNVNPRLALDVLFLEAKKMYSGKH